MVSNFQTYRVWIQIVGTPPQVCHPERPYLRDQLTPPLSELRSISIIIHFYCYFLNFYHRDPVLLEKVKGKEITLNYVPNLMLGATYEVGIIFCFTKELKDLPESHSPLLRTWWAPRPAWVKDFTTPHCLTYRSISWSHLTSPASLFSCYIPSSYKTLLDKSR